MAKLRTLPLLAALTLVGCGSAGGWDPVAVHPQPFALPEGADPLSAYAYYQYGQSIIDRTPDRAADAFYWAHRLDPLWAEPLYARRMALLMSRLDVYDRYSRGSQKLISSPAVQRIDSLYLRALLINPFLLRRQDATALRYAIVERARRDSGGRIEESELRFVIDSWLNQSGAATRGWVAHSEGRFADAARFYEEALRGRNPSPDLYVDLARVYFLSGRNDEARASMTRAVERLRERDDDRLVYLYRSKALYEHALGMILEEMGLVEEARHAYARALQDDLAYHPAHVRLAELALAEGDTATALSEMSLAAELGPEDAGVRLRYGRVLAGAGRHEEAVPEFRGAIELEPFFARPHLDLARSLEHLGQASEAVAEYQAFLEKASRDNNDRVVAEQRIRTLRRTGGGGA